MSNEEEIIKWTRAGYRIRKRVINIEMEFANFGPSRIVELQRRGPASQRDNFLRPMFSKECSVSCSNSLYTSYPTRIIVPGVLQVSRYLAFARTIFSSVTKRSKNVISGL